MTRRASPLRSTTLLTMGVLLAGSAALSACKREKPNANRDLRQNQQQLMDNMDKIAAEIEAEEHAKSDAATPTPASTPAPAPSPATRSPPPADAPAPALPADD